MYSERENREFELKIYIGEIKRQCQNVLTSALIFNQGLKEDNTDLVWYGVQSILNYSGMVSRYFFRKSSLETLDTCKLREIFSIDDSSPLKDRTLRNHFEHFDERVDRWLLKGETIFIDNNITQSRQNIILQSEENTKPVSLRNLIVDELTVSVYDDEINIQVLVQEVDRIYKLTSDLRFEHY